jgi:Glycosyl hydrolase family 76
MTLPQQAPLRLAGALAVALLLACAPRAAAHSAKPTRARATAAAHHHRPVQSIYATRALGAYQAMQQNFYVPGTGLYRGEPEYSFLWPFSQALAATVTLSHIPATRPRLAGTLHALLFGLQQYLGPLPTPPGAGEPAAAAETTAAAQPTGTGTGTGAAAAGSATTAAPAGAATATGATAGASAPAAGLRSYDGNVAPPVGPGGDSYYDDNEWVGIELARLYELDHDAAALQQAEQIIAFVMAGWQTVAPGGQPLPCPGGVPFSNAKGNTARNTVTDGPGAELAVQLYRITHEARYLQFAEMAYGWVRQCLLEPDGLYADHINLNGSIERIQWSYNQGSMMGAGVLLYQATHNGAYLYEARQTAKAALGYFTYSRLSSENPFFVAVYFRNLLYLDSVTHDPPGSLPLREYLYYAWQRHRLSNGLFAYGSPPTAELLQQAAIVQMYALLATPPATYF